MALPIPATLLFFICGLVGIIVYFIQKKKKFSWIWLVLGVILVLTSVSFWIAM